MLLFIAHADLTRLPAVDRLSLSLTPHTRAASTLQGLTYAPTAFELLRAGPLSLDMRAGSEGADQVISQRVDALSGPGDSIFVWGLPNAIYFLTGRQPASRWLYYMPLVNDFGGFSGPSYSTGPMRRQLVAELARRKPTLIVLEPTPADGDIRSIPGFASLLSRRYRLAECVSVPQQFIGYAPKGSTYRLFVRADRPLPVPARCASAGG
jgi:hypothetical protein